MIKRTFLIGILSVLSIGLYSFSNVNAKAQYAFDIEFNDLSISDPIVQKKKTFIKNVWSKIDTNDLANKPLFFPLNEIDIIKDDYYGFPYDSAHMQMMKKVAEQNLWNILIYHLILGEITLYSPFDPDWQFNIDNGNLNYPIKASMYGSSENGTYLIDSLFREYILAYEFIGYEVVDSNPTPFMSIEYGYDSLDYEGNTVYYPNSIYWYQDKDIVYYKIKESWELNEEGEVIDKKLDAIAPVVNQYDLSGNFVGFKTLFWADYKELDVYFENYYFLKGEADNKKVISYKEYFDERYYSPTILEQDSVHVRLKEK